MVIMFWWDASWAAQWTRARKGTRLMPSTVLIHSCLSTASSNHYLDVQEAGINIEASSERSVGSED